MKKLALLVAALVVILSSTALGGPARKPRADGGIAYVGFNHVEGSTGYVSGDLKDRILGCGAIVYVVKVSTGAEPSTIKITARRVTFFTRRGSLTGTGSAIQVIHPDGSTDVKNGVFNLTRGTGALRGRTLRGRFSGPYSDGVYTFRYKGIYR